MPHLVELFSGTQSIGRAFKLQGWQVTSVDIDAKSSPMICLDIMDLTVEDLLEYGNVDLIWASPPCTHYSCARTTAKTPRDLEGSDALVRKVLDLADQLCCYYLMENPQSGLLKSRPVVQGLNYVVLDYCRYGTPYRKRTAIWTNTDFTPQRPLCDKDCASSDGRRHTRAAQRVGRGYSHTLNELYMIPAELCEELATWADRLK
jgi:site-specific DNA-cytosine methylase